MKILILKPSSLGDVVQALPVLRLLKAHNPTSEIYWWISSDLSDLLDGDPDLSGILLFHRQRWASPRYWGEALRSLRRLRAQHFELVLDLQALARSSFVSWMTHGDFCVGLEDWREGAPALYDLAVPRPSPLAHAVEWYLEVLRVLGVPVHWKFAWLPERPKVSATVQRKWQPNGRRWVVLNPGARWSNKRWPVECYAAVVRQLSADDAELHFAIIGSAGDAGLGAALLKANPARCLDLTGQTTLAELVEWIRLSHLVISNDTGPMHIAAALSRPVVAIFGPTEPRRTGPYRQLDNVLRVSLPCAPCLKPRCQFEKPLHCLREVSPEAVCAKARSILSD